jgi:hypothetical protein
MDGSFSAQSITTLIGSTKAFISNKCEVDSGKVIEATVDEAGAIVKVVIQGSKKATVTMEQVFESVEDALVAAIKIQGTQVSALKDNIAAMQGRIENVQREGL